ncbi:hypothetical protein [Micromonospora sp. NPDC049891]|uniref:hypothetical protein n=1 Tax=Micromonospora sp. NPDC049891 TaxID=3155655 RepID=UPI0033EFE2F3
MLPVAPARPLWWLARWATRLLTGFAVAAAFTLGAWALPDEAVPVDRLAATAPAPLVQTAVTQASAEWDRAASRDLAATAELVVLATPAVRGADVAADLGGVSAAQPAAVGQPGLTALGGIAVDATPGPAARVAGVRAARAPPQA